MFSVLVLGLNSTSILAIIFVLQSSSADLSSKHIKDFDLKKLIFSFSSKMIFGYGSVVKF